MRGTGKETPVSSNDEGRAISEFEKAARFAEPGLESTAVFANVGISVGSFGLASAGGVYVDALIRARLDRTQDEKPESLTPLIPTAPLSSQFRTIIPLLSLQSGWPSASWISGGADPL